MPVGQKLIEARQRKALSEEQVSEETRIPLSIIRSLETDDYSGFDSAIYAKNFLKTYGGFLGLNVSEILPRFDELADNGEQIFKPNREPLANTARPAPTQRSRNPLILGPVLAGIFAFLCFSLFSLFTSGTLPFAPGSATAEKGELSEPEALTEAMEGAPAADPATPPALPVEMITLEEGGGAYVDDFHPISSTIFLDSGSSDISQVLP